MSRPLFSPSWHRIAELRPRLRSHVRVHRHRYRGQVWFVLEDLSTGGLHRFRPAAYQVVGLMDGARSVDEIWTFASERLGEDAPTQEEIVRLLAQLHAADLMQTDVPSDSAELLRRYERHRQRTRLSRAMNPFAVQIPLVDPDRFLARTLRFVDPLVGRAGALAWLAVVLPACALFAIHSDAFFGGALDRLLSAQSLVSLWLLFPALKALHELGHAYAAKAFGGEVHEIGVMLLVGSPVPYVDASSSAAFDSRWQRAGVGAAGMLVELFLAALALYVWLAAEPGTLRMLAFNAIVISGITTLGFNANPLLRFDGYYVLSDLLEIPNLRLRANDYLLYLLERYGFGHREAAPPDASASERAWLASYAVASFAYRLLVMLAIAWFVLEWSVALGMLLLFVAGIGWFVVPAVRGVRFLLTSHRLERVRARAAWVSVGTAAFLAVVLVLVPMPLRSRVEGVMWLPEEAHVRAGTAGFVEEIVATPGARVAAGDLLFRLRDPDLEAEVRALTAREERLARRFAQLRWSEPVEAQVAEEELDHARRELRRAQERIDELDVRARTAGTFVCPEAKDLAGRFAQQGQTLARVVDLATLRVRAVVGQADIDLVQRRLDRVEARLAERIGEVREARLRRIVPGASTELPSAALGSEGGGDVVVDLRESATRSVEPLFQLELELPSESGIANAGGRVYLRLDHGSEPLAFQWARRARQLFLARLDV